MKARQLLLFLLLSTSMTGFGATITGSGMSFSPSLITIPQGEVVNFEFDFTHNAVEVSQATWNANGSTPSGGFTVPQGGGSVSNLSVGEHWYVCQFHISSGMKGRIIVTALGVNDFQLAKNFTIFPNPAADFVNISMIGSSFGESYRIMDQAGRSVFSGKLEDVTTAVDLSQFASGIYFLQVGTETRRTFKLVKN